MRLLLLAFVVLFAATVFAVSESITAPSEVTERAAPAAPARGVVKPVEAGETVAAQDARPNPVVPLEAGAPPPVQTSEVWDSLAACESSGRWDIRDSLHEGGLQFAASTWSAFRPDDFPLHAYDATREQQIAVGRRVLDAQGPGAWPICGPRVGLRRGM